MTATIHHARPGRFRASRLVNWRRHGKAARPVVTAVHGATLGDPTRTDFIVTGGQALPGLVERTDPASVKTTTITPDGTTTSYDTQPFSKSQLADDQPQRMPGSSGLQPLAPAGPLSDLAILTRTLDGLKAMPPAADPEPYGGSHLVVLTSAGPLRCTPAALYGPPQFRRAYPAPDGTVFAGIYLGGPDPEAPEPDDRFGIDTADPAYLVSLALSAIDAIPELSSDPSFLEQVIYAAQIKLAKLTNGGPAVEQTGGAQ